ncbi:uncharacterized protein PADG_07329 [Paracoccidioides brasiliensis Pb18]|uniref:Uncharacterized protein n=1 Tax=Paracoccidioides brasiliensis (strain Pb18) TaxID=502780 RepID=C1GJ93_PARBD|nr:uncharacterized protein PADG_07329 [Paracoccidioides brasiliensis Pb18]EEH42509.2 hypothetical protein PADG_07329 [Paracoccidioides brasiliensis Pb18]
MVTSADRNTLAVRLSVHISSPLNQIVTVTHKIVPASDLAYHRPFETRLNVLGSQHEPNVERKLTRIPSLFLVILTFDESALNCKPVCSVTRNLSATLACMALTFLAQSQTRVKIDDSDDTDDFEEIDSATLRRSNVTLMERHDPQAVGVIGYTSRQKTILESEVRHKENQTGTKTSRSSFPSTLQFRRTQVWVWILVERIELALKRSARCNCTDIYYLGTSVHVAPLACEFGRPGRLGPTTTQTVSSTRRVITVLLEKVAAPATGVTAYLATNGTRWTQRGERLSTAIELPMDFMWAVGLWAVGFLYLFSPYPVFLRRWAAY